MHNPNLKAEFVKSSEKLDQCPDTHMMDIAFIGRSNVGKSSLINMLTGQKKLAKTSSTPGKTQHINHFRIDDNWHLVDLPGYGYAKVSKSARGKFKGIIYNYLEKREQLYCTFVLVDIRHKPQQVDLDFFAWMAERGLPFYIVFTKADKLGKTKIDFHVEEYKNEMLKQWEEIPPYFVSSATKKIGRDEILDAIYDIVKD